MDFIIFQNYILKYFTILAYLYINIKERKKERKKGGKKERKKEWWEVKLKK